MSQPVALLFLSKSDAKTKELSNRFLKWLVLIPGLAKQVRVLNTDELVVDAAIELDKLPIIETFQTCIKQNGDEPVLLKGIPDAFLWLIEISKKYCPGKSLIPGQLDREIKGFLNLSRISKENVSESAKVAIKPQKVGINKKKSPVYGAIPFPAEVQEKLERSPAHLDSVFEEEKKIIDETQIKSPILTNSFVVAAPGHENNIPAELLSTPWRRKKMIDDEEECIKDAAETRKVLSNGRNTVQSWHKINGSLKTPVRKKMADVDETNMQLQAETARLAAIVEKSLAKEGITKQSSIGIRFSDQVRMTPRTQKKLLDQQQLNSEEDEYARILQIIREREMKMDKNRLNPVSKTFIPKTKPQENSIRPTSGRGIGIRFPSSKSE